MDDLNKAILECVVALLGDECTSVPLSYGDKGLDTLLNIIAYARIPELRFTDAAKQPQKRNLMEWLLNRKKGMALAHEKLYGFLKLILDLSWRPGVREKALLLLKHPRVVEALAFRQQDVEQWTAKIAGVENPFALNKLGKKVFEHNRHGILTWKHVITVDREGTGTHHITTTVVPLDTGLPGIRSPLFTDKPVDAADLRVWASSSCGITVDCELYEWDKTCGGLMLNFSPAPRYGEKVSFEWGYSTPSLFGPGPEYYRFDINNPTASRVAELRFQPAIRVDNVLVLDGVKTTSPGLIRWELWFPRMGRQEIRFNLQFS
ncbi:MAG TPA: hypothetical protein VGP72_31655 [Planctomycetota bacterium]|jgi:hypothetical protein